VSVLNRKFNTSFDVKDDNFRIGFTVSENTEASVRFRAVLTGTALVRFEGKEPAVLVEALSKHKQFSFAESVSYQSQRSTVFKTGRGLSKVVNSYHPATCSTVLAFDVQVDCKASQVRCGHRDVTSRTWLCCCHQGSFDAKAVVSPVPSGIMVEDHPHMHSVVTHFVTELVLKSVLDCVAARPKLNQVALAYTCELTCSSGQPRFSSNIAALSKTFKERLAAQQRARSAQKGCVVM
jgi:hypothetical protein